MKGTNRFPKVMCTQHPDSISRYISIQEEPEEAIEAVTKDGCDEYMPDYEGKATPYHQNVQIVSKLMEETDLEPGKDVFITPRAPSALHENRFRQLMVMMSIAEANYTAYEHSGVQAITEFVHPMTNTIEEILESQQHMVDVSELAKKEFKFEMESPRIIPLIEDVPGLLDARNIINDTIFAYKERFGEIPESYRAFIGKSDSALSFGHMASSLACKYAISELNDLKAGIDTDIGIIFGVGSLPFRGHLTLENADNFFDEYRGIDTVTLQSALRYNHKEGDARKLVESAENNLSKPASSLAADEKQEMINIIGISGTRYNKAIRQLAPTINRIADFLPRQRDRLMRGGGIGYSRDMVDVANVSGLCRSDIGKELRASIPTKNMSFPRAINFTASLYSIGLPPEIIGTGCAIADVREKLGEDACHRLVTKYLPSLQSDLRFAFEYLDLDSASRFLPQSLQKSVLKDINVLKDMFNLETQCQPSYKMLLEMLQPGLLQTGNSDSVIDEEVSHLLKSTLVQMAKMRKALG